MALNSNQAYALYFLLSTDSSVRESLRQDCLSGTIQDERGFIQAVQTQVDRLKNAVVVDGNNDGQLHGVGALFRGPRQEPNFDPITIRNAFAALNDYGSGSCPVKAEEPSLWKAIEALKLSPPVVMASRATR